MNNAFSEQDKFFSLGVDRVTLTVDDDVNIECEIITLLDLDDKEYIVLLPLDENGENEDGDVWLYEFKRDENGTDHELINIEDDDEYERVADFFDEWLDTQEFLSMEEQ